MRGHPACANTTFLISAPLQEQELLTPATATLADCAKAAQSGSPGAGEGQGPLRQTPHSCLSSALVTIFIPPEGPVLPNCRQCGAALPSVSFGDVSDYCANCQKQLTPAPKRDLIDELPQISTSTHPLLNATNVLLAI